MLFGLEIGLAAALAYAAVTAYRRQRFWLAFWALLVLAVIAVLASGLTSADGSARFLPPRPFVIGFVFAGCGVALCIAVANLRCRRWQAALVAGTVLLGFANLFFAAGNRIHPLTRLRQAHSQVLRVTVYDAATDEPIRGAEVRVFHPCIDPAVPPTRTDADGIAVVAFHILSHSHTFKGHSWEECILAQHVLEVRAESYRPVDSNLAAYMDADNWGVDRSPLPALRRSVAMNSLAVEMPDRGPNGTATGLPEPMPCDLSGPPDERREPSESSLLWLVPPREIIAAWVMALFLTVIGLSRWPRAWLLCTVAVAWLFLLLPFPMWLWWG